MRLFVFLTVLGSSGVLLYSIAESHRTQDSARVAVGDTSMLPLHFAHADHQAVTCTGCHHEFLDSSGPGQCFHCHLSDPELKPLIEQQFHGLCRGCHEKEQRLGQAAGPVRDCQHCHQADDEP